MSVGTILQLVLAVLWFIFGVLFVHEAKYTSATIMLTCSIIEFVIIIAKTIVTRIEHKIDELKKVI